MAKDPNAVALGRMARGVPKNYSPEERARRAARMAEINARRAAGKATPSGRKRKGA